MGKRGEQGPERLGEERREEQDQAPRMEAEGPETDGVVLPTCQKEMGLVSRRGLPGLQGTQITQFPCVSAYKLAGKGRAYKPEFSRRRGWPVGPAPHPSLQSPQLPWEGGTLIVSTALPGDRPREREGLVQEESYRDSARYLAEQRSPSQVPFTHVLPEPGVRPTQFLAL